MLNIRDDLGYKQTQFFSTDVFRQIVKPSYKRAIDWAHARGARVRLHSCGYIAGLLPDIIGLGFDAIHPLEVKAGMNPEEVKQEFGKDIVIHGGFNAMLWKDLDAIGAEMRRLLPVLIQGGGYIFASDHSIPNDVSLANMAEIIRLAKELCSSR
jgi:uroporphyrinogen decarboxylase